MMLLHMPKSQAITSAANYLNGKYLSDCTLYVTRTLYNVCWRIKMGQITRVVYGASDLKGDLIRQDFSYH